MLEKRVPEDAIKIFYSYSRKDLDMRNALENHLSALREAGKISTWHDLELEAGTEWEPTILHKLDTADIILLLISSSFIASKYCYGTELKRAIARHEAGTARVIPIILRPCDWNHSYVPFSKLNVLPTHAKPITQWEDRDAAFAMVAQRIREAVDQLNAQKLQHVTPADIATLKNDAYRAERNQDWDLAQRLWLRVDATASGQDVEAIEALQTISDGKASESFLQSRNIPKPPVQTRAEATSTSVPDAHNTTPNEDDLGSDRYGVNYYTNLRNLLKSGYWKAANQETVDLMCAVMDRQKEGWLRLEDIERFPCQDLRNIDHLWVKYSKGKFGFSVQQKIYLKCGGKLDSKYPGDKISGEFGDLVGWRVQSRWTDRNIIFDASVPEGCLPAFTVGNLAPSTILRSVVSLYTGGQFRGDLAAQQFICFRFCLFAVVAQRLAKCGSK
ncbi:MAG: GUN4 domain-containing protein [Leptolyngbya sp. BL-A-14]